MAKLYFIRHAKTPANVTGSMIGGYEWNNKALEVLPSNLEQKFIDSWVERVGSKIKLGKYIRLYRSPAWRCKQTIDSYIIQNGLHLITRKEQNWNLNDYRLDQLNEFDCSGLGSLKFWEITKEQFEKFVLLTSADMDERIGELAGHLAADDEYYKEIPSNEKTYICVTHGMYIRYLYHYLNGNRDISPYEVINSVGFKFGNLDMLEYDTETKKIEVYRFMDIPKKEV